jgi:hypothetical protein
MKENIPTHEYEGTIKNRKWDVYVDFAQKFIERIKLYKKNY